MDWLKCNICYNTYNESSLRPRSLSCGHTFCEKCLNTAIQNETLTCPQCRKLHEIKSALDIPINFTLEGLLKSLNHSSQNVVEGAIADPIKGKSERDDKNEGHGSLKSLLEQQERSLSAQKELLKTSAGMCIEHPGKELVFRCSLHKSWVCEECIEEHGDHPKHKCIINSFKEEIEDRRQEHKKSLNDEGMFCDETLSLIEKHISYLRDERERNISLLNSFQDLVNMHKKKDEDLQSKIASCQKIIEEGENAKKRLLDVETNVLKAATLDESNAARDMVKKKKVEARNWANSSQREVDESNRKEKRLTHPLCGLLTSETLAGLVKYWETYATHIHEDTQRWGRIVATDDGHILLQDFRIDKPPTGAIIFDLNDVTQNLSFPRHIFLNFSTENTPHGKNTLLGRVVIRVNEEAPRRAQQLVDLCLGQADVRYSGNTATYIHDNGTQMECIEIHCLTKEEEYEKLKKSCPDLEKTECIDCKQGLVTIIDNDYPGDFFICTNTNNSDYIRYGLALGDVVEGLSILEKIIGDDLIEEELKKLQVIISESGLVIDLSCQK